MGILCEAFNLVEILMSSYDGLDTKLRLQCLRLASISDQYGDVENGSVLVFQETDQHGAADIACTKLENQYLSESKAV